MSSYEKGKRPAVPKFTSFKPKTPDTAQAGGGRNINEKSRRTGNQSAETSNPQAQNRQPLGRHAPSNSDSHPLQIPQRSMTQNLDGNGLYIFDKRGDALIRRYGSNDRNHIPAYRRIGAGRILGAYGFMRIEKLGNREEFSIPGFHESRSLLSSDRKSLLARGIRPNSQPVRIRHKPSETGTATEDYLSLKTCRKRKRDDASSGESSSEERPSYRSIQGKSKEHEHSDSDEQFDSDASEDEMNRGIDDPITVRSIELSRKVREHPEDVESWLELVDHQNTLLQIQSGARAPTAAEVKSFADIKLSLLEQALSHAGDGALRERLNLRIMLEGIKVWDGKTASKRFADIMQKYPKSFELWKLNISFRQATLSTCRYDEIKQLYIDKLQSLGKELATLPSHSNQILCSEQIIYVFLRLTRFLADAGFVELASAAWQATLELSFARPSTLPSMEWEAPSSFQDFWESEVPRIGEEGWRGWAAFERDPSAQEPPDPGTSPMATTPTTRDGYKAWHTVEQYRAWNSTIPARTLDDGAEDDPFRVVMFADIQDFLLYLPTEMILQLRRQLLDAFLLFLQLPSGLESGDIMNEAAKDSFLARGTKVIPFTHLLSKIPIDGSEHQQHRPPEFCHDIHRIYPTSEVLFPSTQWFRYMGQVRDTMQPDRYRWISTTLKQLTRVVGVRELGPYSLAFESINEPGYEKKSAKALLRQDPSNIDLYLGFSILERERGDKAAARNVLSAVRGLPTATTHDRVRIGIGAAWLELDEWKLAKAALQLCWLAENASQLEDTSMLESAEATPSQILKTQQFLAMNRDYDISSSRLAYAVIYAEGLVLLEYLTRRSEKEPRSSKQGDIWSAIASISQCSGELKSRGHEHSPAHEKFLQFAARLLYYHASHGSFRPSLLREQLVQYISYFPSNTIFLHLFAWREERLSINDRVLTLLRNHVLTRHHESLPAHVFAISYELRTGNAHSTRAAFERALCSDVCAHHVGLWISYIRFCHARKELRTKAKSVFYRAIQACPWSKDVFMEAFDTLARDMDSGELKSVYATMCEKGLRVHVDMEEFVAKWRREQKGVENERSSGKKR
ncbi:DUF1740-domain-containing protein [Xylariaceae sp. FL1651]|nr:DUF1740-domain-containing protein [Xylariaceae sp. FL1651]